MRLHPFVAGVGLVALTVCATPTMAGTPIGSGATRPGSCVHCTHARPDFDNDGFADLAIGSEIEVYVLYGSPSGATAAGDQVFNKLTPGMPGPFSSFDWFGQEIAWGDIDGDGYDDMAIGAPGFSKGSDFRGAVVVLYGGASGLTTVGAQRFTLATPGIPGNPTLDNYFGESMAMGDFDHDGHADLAIGNEGGPGTAGSVDVLRGTANGLSTTGVERWWADRAGVPGRSTVGDRFGRTMETADFNKDGFTDLAIGALTAHLPHSKVGPGSVTVLLGSAGGLTTSGAQIYQPTVKGIAGHADGSQFFGVDLAAGDFDDDGVTDLAIGSIYEQAGSNDADFSGAVHVLYGRARTASVIGGLQRTGSQLFNRLTAGLAAPAKTQDLGAALAAIDLDKNGTSDLLIGSPRDTVNGVEAGTLRVLFGFPGTGVTTFGSQVISEATAGIPGSPTKDGSFARQLGVGDFDKDGHGDVAITGTNAGDGVVTVLKGDVPLTGAGAVRWNVDATGLNDGPIRSFGWSIAH